MRPTCVTRREVLALPLLFGLGCSRGPSWFAQALGRIRNDGRPGLVVRLPKDPLKRCALGHTLAALKTSRVVLCLEGEDVDRLLYGAEGDLMWIDAEGRVTGTLDDLKTLGAGSALPYGVSIGTASKCAENPSCYVDTCCFCGMGAVMPRSGAFIKFIAD